MKKTLILVGLFIAVALPPSLGDTIYNVSFEDPPHTIDTAVATGVGMNDRPDLTIGTVVTRAGLADFSTQVASLEPAGLMRFFVSTPSSAGLVTLSWEMAILSFGPGGLSDTAQVTIEPSGVAPLVMSWQRDYDFTIDGANVATFALGQHDHYEILLDLDNDTYDFALNGTAVMTNQALNSSFDVHYVSFGSENLQSPSYAVDNFSWETIPEPSTWLLMTTGSLAVVYGNRILKAKKDARK